MAAGELNRVEDNLFLESMSIDELWRTSSPSRRSRSSTGGCSCGVDEIYHSTEEGVSESPYLSGSETVDSPLELARASGNQGRKVEPEYMAGDPIRIPEAASHSSFESAMNQERAVEELRRENDEDMSISTLTLHTNELFDQSQKGSVPLAFSSNRPLIPIHLQFEDIRYKIALRKGSWQTTSAYRDCRKCKQTKKQDPADSKHILHGVSGSVKPGEILAMMGPSGSGKTTLLSILGGRLMHGERTGNVSYNGLFYASALKRRIGYVSQDDVLFPILTVKETLEFAALLRLSSSISRKDKLERAWTVLQELGLERCQNTIVGGQFVRGVSGGERKRTSIGYEILVNPSLLLLDEPTSGLDSSTAYRIMQVLKANAQAGRVIVATIHQPSSRMFPMFDKLILLSEGHPMYYGATKDAMGYFASLQFTPQMSMNPCDFLLDLASGITSDISVPQELSKKTTCTKVAMRDYKQVCRTLHQEESVKTEPEHHDFETNMPSAPMQPNSDPDPEESQNQLVVQFLRVKYRCELEQREKGELHRPEEHPEEHISALKSRNHRSSSWLQQFMILCSRNCKERRKDYVNILRFAQCVAVAVLLGLLWWRPKLESEQEIRDQVGLLFYICIFWCTFSMWSTLMVFPLEKNYLAKERASDMYSLSAYFLSSTICDLLAELMHPTLFIALVYFMTGLKSDFITFMFTLLSVYLIAMTAQAFGEFFGAATLSVKKVGIVSSMLMLIFLLAGGYYVQKIPVFLRWIRYISIVFYGFNLLQRVQYSPEQTYLCGEIEGCLRFDESPIFANLNLEGGMHDAFALIAMALVYKFLAYLCLRRV